MELILKQYDIPLLRFSATNDSCTPEIEVHWINEDQRHLLPLDMELSPEGISRWMRRRTIPRNRAYVNRLLAKCGLNANRPMGIPQIALLINFMERKLCGKQIYRKVLL